MSQYIRRKARLFKAGDYPDKNCSVSEQDLAAICQRSNMLGNIPTDLNHANTETVINTGYVVGGSLFCEAGELFGEIDIPVGVDDNLIAKGLSVVLNTSDKLIRKLTFTSNPRIAEAVLFDDNLTHFYMEDTFMTNEDQQPIEAIEEFATCGTPAPVAEEGAPAIQEPAQAEEPQAAENQAEPTAEAEPEPAAEAFEAEEPQATAPEALEAAPEPEPVQEPAEPQAEFSAPADNQVEAEALSEVDQLRQLLADKDRELQSLREAKQEQQIASFSADQIKLGVPPVIANLLSPFAVGATEVLFDDEPMNFTATATRVLELLQGTVSFSAVLPEYSQQQSTLTFDSDDFGKAVQERALSLQSEKGYTRQQALSKAYVELGKTKE